jgi:hypothetical protein
VRTSTWAGPLVIVAIEADPSMTWVVGPFPVFRRCLSRCGTSSRACPRDLCVRLAAPVHARPRDEIAGLISPLVAAR